MPEFEQLEILDEIPEGWYSKEQVCVMTRQSPQGLVELTKRKKLGKRVRLKNRYTVIWSEADVIILLTLRLRKEKKPLKGVVPVSELLREFDYGID